ncbi:MAG: hypothetical protein RLZZ385_2739 [Pseudomonadota bacterium]
MDFWLNSMADNNNMNLKPLILLLVGLLAACGSAPDSTTLVMDLPSYKTYVSNLQRSLSAADADSFEIGEQARLLDISQQLLAAIDNVSDFQQLSPEQQQAVVMWNDELHVLMVGADESRAEGRICRTEVATGSNIRTRSCRTREQLTRERQSARLLLLERSDDVDRIRLDDRTRPVTGFGTAPPL